MGSKHVALTDAEYVVIGRRHGSEAVRQEAGEAIERAKRDVEVLKGWGFGSASLGVLEGLMGDHGGMLASRSEAVAAKKSALAKRDGTVNSGWRYVHQLEGAMATLALAESELAVGLNAALPAETDGLEAGILAMARLLDTWKDKVDADFDPAAKIAEAEGLAASVKSELDSAPIAKAAPVADTREIDQLDGRLATWLSRLNKTARRAFRDLGDDVKVKEYRFHHLSRGGTAKPASPAPSPAPAPEG